MNHIYKVTYLYLQGKLKNIEVRVTFESGFNYFPDKNGNVVRENEFRLEFNNFFKTEWGDRAQKKLDNLRISNIKYEGSVQ